MEKISVLQNGPISALQIGGGFTIDKSGQEALQVGSYRHFKSTKTIINRGNKISNRGRDYKLAKNDFKSEQEVQIGAEQPHTFPPGKIYWANDEKI